MRALSGIRATGAQTIRTNDENGVEIRITLKFRPGTSQWFMDLEKGSVALYGVRITNSANMLWEFAKVLNFGIGVVIPDGGDPFLINDFSSGRVSLNILDMDELTEVDGYYVGIRG